MEEAACSVLSPQAFGVGGEGTAGPHGSHDPCMLPRASQVMDTKVLLGGLRTYQPSTLPSPFFPVSWAPAAMGYAGEGALPELSFDLPIPKAHGRFCCPHLPPAQACPFSLRTAAIKIQVLPLPHCTSFQKGFFSLVSPTQVLPTRAGRRVDLETPQGP